MYACLIGLDLYKDPHQAQLPDIAIATLNYLTLKHRAYKQLKLLHTLPSMANSPTPTTMVLAVMAVGLTTLLIAAGPAAAQNCGCQPDVCCSKYGYCGTTSAYCGEGCRSGPCQGSSGGGGGAPSGGASVASVVTSSFFNGIKSHAGRWCEGLGFYTLGAFLEAAGAYPGFARDGSEADGKREIAAFFAHVTHETGRKLLEA